MIVDISFDIVEYTLNSIYKPFTSWNYIFFISEPYVLKILFSPQAFSTPLCASLVLLISLADFSAV